MDAWVERALQRWPNVPHLYGWLRLDRRGNWLIRGERISRRQIIQTINRNYATDERGCWYFQNGPQRGYVALDACPLILRVAGDGVLQTHTGLAVTDISEALLDEDGAIYLRTQHGPGLLDGPELEWALERLCSDDGAPISERALTQALDRASGESTDLWLMCPSGMRRCVRRIDARCMPEWLGYIQEPQPPTA